MKLSGKSALIAALGGTVIATVAFAEMGPGGGMGGEDHGQMLLEMFKRIDTDKDGKLSLAELQAHRATEFAGADANGDGSLDAGELSDRMMARFQEKLPARAQHMIDNHDNDGNGLVSADEMGQGPAEDHFARIDTDNDGAISKEEAEAAVQHRKKRGHGWGMGHGEGEGEDEGEGGN